MTPQDVEQAALMRDMGATWKSISSRMGLPYQTLRNAVLKEHPELKQEHRGQDRVGPRAAWVHEAIRHRETGMSIKEVARRVGKTATQVRGAIKTHRPSLMGSPPGWKRDQDALATRVAVLEGRLARLCADLGVAYAEGSDGRVAADRDGPEGRVQGADR